MDVESISGKAVSHWTELADRCGPYITIHLQGELKGNSNLPAI